ncbi:MAG: hypothetical protein V3U75_12875 [Methylococcaceae bacterium]
MPPNENLPDLPGLKLAEHPTWWYICIVLKATKEHAEGVRLTKQLLEQAQSLRDKQKARSPLNERLDRIISGLWLSYLDFLDRADEWEEYIRLADYLHKQGIFAGRLHFGYLSKPYNIIKRKLERVEAGKNTAHLKHKQSYDLTEGEYNRRLAQAKGRVEYLVNPSMLYSEQKDFQDWVARQQR